MRDTLLSTTDTKKLTMSHGLQRPSSMMDTARSKDVRDYAVVRSFECVV